MQMNPDYRQPKNAEVIEEMFAFLIKRAKENFADTSNIDCDFRETRIPSYLRRFLRDLWPARGIVYDRIRLWGYKEILNDRCGEVTLLSLTAPVMMLPIGNGANGDAIVLSWNGERCFEVGYLCTDLMVAKSPPCPEEGYVMMFRQFGEFIYRMVEGLYVPGDAVTAREFNEMIIDLRVASLTNEQIRDMPIPGCYSAPNKAEQDGGGQPATRPESK